MSGIRKQLREDIRKIIRPFAAGTESDARVSKTIYFHKGLCITTSRDHSTLELWFTGESKHPRRATKENKVKITLNRKKTGKLTPDEHLTVKAIYGAGYIGHLYAARFRCSMRVARAMFVFTANAIIRYPATTLNQIVASQTCKLILQTPYKDLERLSVLSESPRAVSAPLFETSTEESDHPRRKRVKVTNAPPEAAYAPVPVVAPPVMTARRAMPIAAITMPFHTLAPSEATASDIAKEHFLVFQSVRERPPVIEWDDIDLDLI